jgi:hypothetical protein
MTKLQPKTFINWFFKDEHGKWAIIQWPNVLLSLWIASVILGLLLHDARLKHDLKLLQDALLFAWAYLEATDGTSKFRKLLGIVVLVMVVVGYFS